MLQPGEKFIVVTDAQDGFLCCVVISTPGFDYGALMEMYEKTVRGPMNEALNVYFRSKREQTPSPCPACKHMAMPDLGPSPPAPPSFWDWCLEQKYVRYPSDGEYVRYEE